MIMSRMVRWRCLHHYLLSFTIYSAHRITLQSVSRHSAVGITAAGRYDYGRWTSLKRQQTAVDGLQERLFFELYQWQMPGPGISTQFSGRRTGKPAHPDTTWSALTLKSASAPCGRDLIPGVSGKHIGGYFITRAIMPGSSRGPPADSE